VRAVTGLATEDECGQEGFDVSVPNRRGNKMIERTGEAFELDERLTVVGHKVHPGEKAPGFALDYFDPDDSKIYTVLLPAPNSIISTKATKELIHKFCWVNCNFPTILPPSLLNPVIYHKEVRE